jgi:hypothetical protein
MGENSVLNFWWIGFVYGYGDVSAVSEQNAMVKCPCIEGLHFSGVQWVWK